MLIAILLMPSAGSPTIDIWMKIAGGGVIALVTLIANWRGHVDRATFDMIDKLYSLCHTLEQHALKEWNVSHLFCVGMEEYNSVKNRIMHAPENDRERRSEFIVKEKLFAIHIFICFEQVYYQFENTAWFMWRRRKFLRAVRSYFADRLISKNPRLIAFLQKDPSGETLHLEQCSTEYLKRQVGEHGFGITADTEGPFVIDTQEHLGLQTERRGEFRTENETARNATKEELPAGVLPEDQPSQGLRTGASSPALNGLAPSADGTRNRPDEDSSQRTYTGMHEGFGLGA